MKRTGKKIITCLWFDSEAGEAVEFYTGVFGNSGSGRRIHYGKTGQKIHGQPPGKLSTVEFWIENHHFVGLNGGPHFKLNPSVSIFVLCETQPEVETYVERLSTSGKILMPLGEYEWSQSYAWIQDKYGLNWQIMMDDSVRMGQKVCPLLFFTGDRHGQAKAAIEFYTDVFRESNIEGIQYYGQEDPYTEGKVKHAQFNLQGHTFMAMDSGVENDFPFSEATSFIVHCKDQDEIDYYWKELSREGDEAAGKCGWLKDKFGVSWQIVPEVLPKFLSTEDERSERVTQALLQMKKLDIQKLEEAFRGPEKS